MNSIGDVAITALASLLVGHVPVVGGMVSTRVVATVGVGDDPDWRLI